MTTRVKRPSGRDEVVDALLRAAARLIARSGPADVSLRAIAREAGVNHGMVHRHVGTRDDLFDRLIERMDLFAAGAAEGAASDGDWLRVLAWSLLLDARERGGAERGFPARGGVPGSVENEASDNEGVTAAAAVALTLGWGFFRPFIRAALHLEGANLAQLDRAMHDAARGLDQGQSSSM